ncbi:hypothetical protein HA052_26990 [Chromobacterium haemolyticum]|uniref:Uncharacterized protein n=1 Tax=Chromobacterium fluminis TaxID=3044269 RepID=A0ABX0LB65_9NEIS|nr:hypothetical protein [Chromobacterium haemolyticum]NHR08839.1 hypothetical protein [Chromobacterium haemolyticum]
MFASLSLRGEGYFFNRNPAPACRHALIAPFASHLLGESMNFNMNAAQFQHKLAEMEEENLMLRLQLDVYRDELFKKYESFLDEKLTSEMDKKLSLDVRKAEADMRQRMQEEIKLLREELQRLRGPEKASVKLNKVEKTAEVPTLLATA